jgi:hypothetical protein
MRTRRRKKVLGLGLCAGLIISSLGIIRAETFQQQRNRFRDEIKYKTEEQLDKDGLYIAVMFDKDVGRWDFQVSDEEAERIKKHLQEYFSLSDQALLAEMVRRMNSGAIIVYKEYLPNADGVNLKTTFLSPKVHYWEMLTDINGIENLFHVYNFSVAFGKKTPVDTYVLLQTQGTFLGFTKAVTLPLIFHADHSRRTLGWSMPPEKDLVQAVNELPVLTPGRESLGNRFIDTCRTHPMFQEKDPGGNYVISDEQIMRWLSDNIIHKDSECDVKDCYGQWKAYEEFDQYNLICYSLLTVVNIAAFIPPDIPAISRLVKKFAQMVSDEVSARYLPLSMKNYRDHTHAAAQKEK